MFRKNISFFIGFVLLLLISFLLSACFFFHYGSLYVTSDPSGAIIYLNNTNTGKVTPSLISNLSPGSYLLQLSLEDPSKSREEKVIIFQSQVTSVHIELSPQTDYRALCIGIDEYQHPGIVNLNAPPYDVVRMKKVFENTRFGDQQSAFTSIDTLIGKQATRANILQSIASSFSEAKSNDISYFYFSGHGWSDGSNSTILPYDAIAENASMDITVDELALALGSISGIKVVILDCCYSGGFIGKEFSVREKIDTDALSQFNENIIESFVLNDLILGKANLAVSGFQVIVSAAGDQKCWETSFPHPIDGNPYGFFSASLCEGCGYNDFTFPFPADFNMDSQINLKEIYQYIKTSLVDLEQDVQIYPKDSTFIFVEF